MAESGRRTGERERSARQRWAAPGSRHDRVVAVARVVLPTAIGVLSAFLVMAPLTASGDVSFVLDKNKVEVARERLKIQRAQYRGQDDKGQAFELTAGSATQRSSSEPIVQLRALEASMQLPEGPAEIVGQRGHYNMDSQKVAIDGPIAFTGAGGYKMDTSNATIDLTKRTMHSAGSVTGTVPQGRFSADRLNADLDSRTVTLNGNARLRIVPRGAK